MGLRSLQRAEPALGRSSRRAIAGDGVGDVEAGEISRFSRAKKDDGRDLAKRRTLDPNPATINTSDYQTSLRASPKPTVNCAQELPSPLEIFTERIYHIFLFLPGKPTPPLHNRNPHQNGAAYPATSANPAGRAKHSSSSIDSLMDVYARVKHHEWHVKISEPARKES